MNVRSTLLAGLLVAPSLLIGQQSAGSFGVAGMESSTSADSRSGTVFITVPGGQACPVGLQAKQGSATDLVKVRKGPDADTGNPPKPGQLIQLILTNPVDKSSALKIVGATVTARGLSARGRIENASGSRSADIRRTLNVTFTSAPEGGLATELVLPGFTAVKSIKIEALEYADGSTRDLAGQKLCIVQPAPLMLIAGR
ncbi:MAG TPA: hypothetical protein VGL22_09585 [Terracidiphilus sp.]|jgi:hypothetical protein